MYRLDNSMTSAPLVSERVFNLPLNTVWQSLTSKNALREWYFPQLRDVKPIVGFVFKFTDEGSTFQKEWRVTQVVGAQKFAHTWAYKGYRGLSEVSFSYSPRAVRPNSELLILA
ncbi:SRPBCC family protein [Spirosoma harenae]